jgi:hypothetical protein
VPAHTRKLALTAAADSSAALSTASRLFSCGKGRKSGTLIAAAPTIAQFIHAVPDTRLQCIK